MPENVKACPLCASTTSSIFDQRKFRSQPVKNRFCQNCGLVYQSPRMTGEELDAFYESEYRQLYEVQEGPDLKDLAVQAERADALLQFTQPHVKAVKRHLDIGCSAGLLLKRFMQVYQNDATGVEPGAAYREYAKSSGLTIWESLEELHADQVRNEGNKPQLFDLVSMAHVLEHLPDPVGHLIKLRKDFLQPGGHLLIEVPNLYCHESFEVAHLVSYSEHTLTQTLQRAGYEITIIRKQGQPRSDILPLYLTALARPVEDPEPYQVIPERGVKRKRQVGLLQRRAATTVERT